MVTLSIGVDVDHNFAEGVARVEALIPRLDEAMYRVAERGIEVIADSYRDLINVDTGRTRGTIGSVVEASAGGGTGYAGSDDENAERLEYGTRSHVIEASPGSGLAFSGIVRNWVLHPGTPEYAPLLRAGMGSMFEVEVIAIDEVEDVLGSV